jgi:serine/threonine protein kinase
MNQSPTCPDAHDLRRFACGQTAGPDAERITRHVQHCARCRGILSCPQTETLAAPSDSPPPGEEEPTAGCPLPGIAGPPLDFLAPPQAPDEIGWLGGYRIRKVLGQGGMGLVFLAEDVHLQRPVALKVLLPRLAEEPQHRQRFLREARAAAGLHCDHVVTIYQVGEDRGLPFLAMELLRGEPLDRWLKRGQRPAVPQVLRLGKEIALGLAAAHDKGLIHRDIKPGNVWLEAPKGRVKILDFGLARPAQDEQTVTRPGLIVGTPAYMSPEQARAETMDPRSDLFSLGCVLYELLAGKRPFQGPTTMAQLAALLVDEPPALTAANPETPAELAELVQRLMKKKPTDRPASARAAADALQGLERTWVARTALSATANLAPSVPAPEQPSAFVGTEATLPGADADDTDPPPPAGKSSPARRRPKAPRGRQAKALPWGRIAAVGGGCFLLALGVVIGVVLLSRPTTGTVELLSEDRNVRVVVENNGQWVATLDGGSSRAELPAGEYQLRLAPGAPWLQLAPDRLAVTRGETFVVNVRRREHHPGEGPHHHPPGKEPFGPPKGGPPPPPRGTVELHSDDWKVRVVVERKGQRLATLDAGSRRVELPAGEYWLRLERGIPWLEVVPDRLTVNPGANVRVSVRRRERRPGEGPRPPPPGKGPFPPPGQGSPR